MKKLTVHDKAIRLLEGGIVEINGNWFRVKRLPKYYQDSSCLECNLDSICGMEHVEVCCECDAISQRKCFLELANKG